jgi:hypothetical protein
LKLSSICGPQSLIVRRYTPQTGWSTDFVGLPLIELAG